MFSLLQQYIKFLITFHCLHDNSVIENGSVTKDVWKPLTKGVNPQETEGSPPPPPLLWLPRAASSASQSSLQGIYFTEEPTREHRAGWSGGSTPTHGLRYQNRTMATAQDTKSEEVPFPSSDS